MNEYSLILSKYKDESYSIYFNTENEDWGDTLKAKEYLDSYWLSDLEYNNVWLKIQKKIFSQIDNVFPCVEFRDKFNIIAMKGGMLFCEEDFSLLKKCISRTNDTKFVIIENPFSPYHDKNVPPIRLKFPSTISWNEISSGNYISSVILNFPEKEYFVFGDSCCWAKYSANDYIHPFDIIGFNDQVVDIFTTYFKISKEEEDEIYRLLPENYKKKIKMKLSKRIENQ